MWQKIKNIYHLFMALVANIIFFFPGRKLSVIGVSGTDGKTTTVSLIYHILKESGEKASMLSSIAAYIDGKEFDTGFHVTTPSSFSLQKLLKEAVSKGSKYFVLEVTSHAIDQYRIWGIPFRVAVLTNVTSEHLDYHKTFDAYLNTKRKLLESADVSIVNKDDSSYLALSGIKKTKKEGKLLTYSLKQDANTNTINFPFESEELIGDFNKQNVLAAVSVCRVLRIDDRKMAKAIKTFKMPLGRLDFVYKKDFAVVIDFAHTPNAFDQLLSFLKPKVKGRIIHVFGSAGERDKEKRANMGKASSKYSDIVILTSEDPRSEDAGQIISQIESGIENDKVDVRKIIDRREAIKTAIDIAKSGDLILITGKAHEKSMNLGKGEIPWDEYKEVSSALSGRN